MRSMAAIQKSKVISYFIYTINLKEERSETFILPLNTVIASYGSTDITASDVSWLEFVNLFRSEFFYHNLLAELRFSGGAKAQAIKDRTPSQMLLILLCLERNFLSSYSS